MPDLPQRISIRHAKGPDGTHTIAIEGEIDIFSAGLFETALEEACDGGAVVVDLRECRYIDSSTITALIRLRKKNRNHIRIVTNGKGAVRRVLSLSQIDKIITVDSGDV